MRISIRGIIAAVDKDFAVRKAGSQRKLAELLKVTPAAVSQWGAELPELQAFRLREIKPRWFAEYRRSRTTAAATGPGALQEAGAAT